MLALSMVSQAVLFLPIELLLLQDMWIFFCAFSGKAADADRAVSAITQTLTQLGFVVHEQSRASAAADFVGLRLRSNQFESSRFGSGNFACVFLNFCDGECVPEIFWR